MPTISAALAALAQADFPLLIIGGNALEAYQRARPTFDTDCMIAAENKEGLREVLAKSGYRWMGTFASFEEFRFEGSMDTAPIHAMFVAAETFEKMWAESVPHTYGGSQLRVPAIAHLIALKLHALKNRPDRQGKDMRDIIHLLELNPGVVAKDELRQLCTRYASAESIRPSANSKCCTYYERRSSRFRTARRTRPRSAAPAVFDRRVAPDGGWRGGRSPCGRPAGAVIGRLSEGASRRTFRLARSGRTPATRLLQATLD